MARPAAREPGPRVTLVRCRTVANVLSMGFVTGMKDHGAAGPVDLLLAGAAGGGGRRGGPPGQGGPGGEEGGEGGGARWGARPCLEMVAPAARPGAPPR